MDQPVSQSSLAHGQPTLGQPHPDLALHDLPRVSDVTRTHDRLGARLAVALLAGVVLAGLMSACGSGGSGTVAQQAQQAASTASSHAQSKLDPTTKSDKTSTASSTASKTQPAKTTTVQKTNTVTQSAPSTTVTETKTASAPTHTASITAQTTSVQVAPTSTTGQKSGGGVPGWGWVLIGLGIAAVAVGIFLFGRHRSGGQSSRTDQAAVPNYPGTGVVPGPVPPTDGAASAATPDSTDPPQGPTS
jgi:hypothetical protein